MDEMLDNCNLFSFVSCWGCTRATEQCSKFEALLKEKEEEWNIEEGKWQALKQAEEGRDIKLLCHSLVHKALVLSLLI